MINQFHEEIKAGVIEFLRNEGWITATEVQLPNLCIADIIATRQDRRILIVEAKSTLRHFHTYESLSKYLPFCHVLYTCSPDEDDYDLLFPKVLMDWHPYHLKCGHLRYENNQITLRRQAQPHELPANIVEAIYGKVLIRSQRFVD